MALRNADRVLDTSTTTGTGNFTVSGTAASSYITFSQIPSIATNDTFWYCIAHQSANEYEVGLGTWQGSNAFARTQVFQSSNSGSLVNFSAGTKNCMVTLPSQHANNYVRPPTSALFSTQYLETGTTISTAYDASLGFSMIVTDSGTVVADKNRFVGKAVASGNWTAIFRQKMNAGTGNGRPGVGIIESTGKKNLTFVFDTRLSTLSIYYWSTLSGYSSTPFNVTTWKQFFGEIWFKIEYDGTNYTFYYSYDGIGWLQAASLAKASYFTATHIGMFIETYDSTPSGVLHSNTCLYYSDPDYP